MKKILFNIKTNMSIKDTKEYLESINGLENINKNFVFFLNHLKLFLTDAKDKWNISFGTQSFSKNSLGSFTSSNPLEQIADFKNINYCLLGHYEERKNFKLTNYDVNFQVSKCLEFNKIPIVCFGDSELFEDYNQRILYLQIYIDEILKNNLDDKVELAYEPNYLIGSNLEIDLNEINKVILDLKEYIKEKYNLNIKIHYGGNINANNFYDLYNSENIDGLLIGRYSLEKKNIQNILDLIK